MPQGIELSNLQKVFWPEEGLTKGDLLGYLEAVAHAFLPVLHDRPLTVIRYPDGIDGMSFYQKNTPKYAPDWVQTVDLHAESAKRTVSYTVANRERTLLWLANQASIEYHPWLSRIDRIERPDQLVFDLDPTAGDFSRAVGVAMVLREVLDEMGLQALPKTSGGKGVHIVVPLERRHDWGIVRAAAERIGAMVAERIPEEATTEFRIEKREGRVYLDPGRNAPGAHVASVYSPRARPGAPVSFPVPWDRLEKVSPADFTIRNVPKLVGSGDPWREQLPSPQRLPAKLLG
jgi:DNA ligase D